MKSPLILTVATILAGRAIAGPVLDFQRDVRPLLSNHCYQCHGPDEKARKAKLRLDEAESALAPAKSGETAIVPHKPEASELVARIFSSDEDEVMPPRSANKPLTDEQKKILKQWIAEGAVYTKHWAFTKPVRPATPKVQGADILIRNPIDAFVAEKLESAKLRQSPPADPYTLARRVALDLTGLPPDPGEAAAFAADPTDKAYEALVDKLLQSPHYGERWARRWLDLARYADTNGYEKDRARSIWPYRDWVIKAFNDDMPFDKFTIEQIAGDMLPHPTPSQIVATGFHRNTMLNEEGGIDPLEFRFHAMTDRVATTGATWLGLTLGCAQCHTHKFDPITHKEYYSLMAFLNNADEPDYDLPDADKEKDYRSRLKRAEALTQALVEKHRDSEAVVFESWLAEQRGKTVAWNVLRPNKMHSNMPLLTAQKDGSVLGSGDITKSDQYDLDFATGGNAITALRLEALPDDSLPAHGPGMCFYEGPKGDFFMGEFQVAADGKPVKIASATETYAKNNFGKNAMPAFAAADGDPQTGWSCAGRYGERHVAVFVFDQPVKASTLHVKMLFGRHYACSLGHFRISATGETKPAIATTTEPALEKLLLLPQASLRADDRERLFTAYVLTDKKFAREAKEIRDLRQPPDEATSLVMRERPAGNPRKTFIHHRGEFTQTEDEVQPGTLAALHPFPADAPRNRLGLARWLVSPDNPLTPRVVVNRQWAVFFGRGIVKTVEDFGYQGSPPSHPELLDFLATEFVRQGWSFKKLDKLIVMSATYRQSSRVPAESLTQDAENILLSHFPRVRLDAELVRDSALASSGLLTPTIGGPSVYPPQPDSVTEAAYGKFKWEPSTGADRYRRSLYTFSKRTAPFAMYTTFDGPTGEACLAKRETSNTALQALTALNDIILTEAEQAMGKTFADLPADDAANVRNLYQRILCRPPDEQETTMLTRFIAAQRDRLKKGEIAAEAVAGIKGAKAIEAAVWTLAARALFNVDEFVTKG